MLSQLEEGGKVSGWSIRWCPDCSYVGGTQEVCHQYWPGEGPERYGEYTVENTGEETHDGYIKRNLMMADKVTLTVVWAPCIHLYNQLTNCNSLCMVHVRKVHISDSTA